MRRVSLAVQLLLCAVAAAAVPGALAHDGCRVADVDSDGYVTDLDYEELSKAMGQAEPRDDLDGNGTVGKEDVAILMSFMGADCSQSCPADLDNDGDVDAGDRKRLVFSFGLDCRANLDRDGAVDADGVGSDDDTELLLAYAGGPVPPSSPQSRADFDADADVDADDLDYLMAAVPRNCRADLNKDGQVDVTDVWALLSAWGACP